MASFSISNLSMCNVVTTLGVDTTLPLSLSNLYISNNVSLLPPQNQPLNLGHFRGLSLVIGLSIGTPIVSRQTTNDANNNFTFVQISSDLAGNIYVVGTYISTDTAVIANLNGTNSSFTLPATSGIYKSFIASWTSSGSCRFGGAMTSASNTLSPVSIAATSDGRFHVIGQYSSGSAITLLNLNNGTSSTTSLPASASTATYYVLYDTSGSPLMAADIFVGGSVPWAIRADLNNSNNVCIMGQYTATGAVKNLDGTTSSITIPSTTANDPFVLKYNALGICTAGINLFSGSATDIARTGEFDGNGNFYVTGQISTGGNNPVKHFTGSNSTFTIGPSGGTDAFLTRHNSNGICTGACTVVSGNNNDVGLCLASDSLLNLYVGGSYQSTVQVNARNLSNNSSSAYILNTTSNVATSFVVKMNSNGVVTGGAQILSTNLGNQCTAIGANSQGAYVFGFYTSGTNSNITVRNLDGSDSSYILSSTSNVSTAYAIRYNQSGVCTGASHIIQGTGATRVSSCRVYGNNVYIAGRYQSTSNVIVRDLVGSNTNIVLPSTSGSLYPFCLCLQAT